MYAINSLNKEMKIIETVLTELEKYIKVGDTFMLSDIPYTDIVYKTVLREKFVPKKNCMYGTWETKEYPVHLNGAMMKALVRRGILEEVEKKDFGEIIVHPWGRDCNGIVVNDIKTVYRYNYGLDTYKQILTQAVLEAIA